MINLTIDGRSISVPKGTTVYNAAKQLGINIPIFCYLDRMPPFGACRICLVQVEKMGKLQASCTLEATEGMVVKTESTPAVEGRKDIIEFLLLNHPLDCPICDRGGECPLQEHAYDHGPGESRFFEEKRHFKKPVPLGPVLMLDRERCIVCARCTRFGDLIAGDHALEFIERGYKTEVGTPDGGPAESKFIGNTITICPVGALTSQVYRFRARPWDNEPTNSSCTLCPVGCSLILDARDGEIMRTRARENQELNDIWLCDKGWFGYEFVTHPDRLKQPLMRKANQLIPVSWEEAFSRIATEFQQARQSSKLAGWGGNPLTIEENYLFQKLIRSLGSPHVDHRIGMPLFTLEEEGISAGMETSLAACEALDYAILLGVDLTEEFPLIWLRLRQAINRGAEVHFFGHFSPEIAPYLTTIHLHAPGQEIETIQQQLSEKLQQNKQGALFVGRQYLATTQRRSILAKLLTLQAATAGLALHILEGRGNSRGARLAGMRPDLAPAGEKLTQTGLNPVQLLAKIIESGWDALYVVGADPANKYDAKTWATAREKIRFLLVQDLFLTDTAQAADLVLPALCFVEKGGNFVSLDGKLQPLLPGKEAPEGILSDAEIFKKIAHKMQLPLEVPASFFERIQNESRPKQLELIPSSLRHADLLVTLSSVLFDHGVRMKHNPHVVKLVKDPHARIHPVEAVKRSLRDGQKVHVRVNGQTIPLPLKWDETVARNTVILPLGFPNLKIQDLKMYGMNGTPIEITQNVD